MPNGHMTAEEALEVCIRRIRDAAMEYPVYEAGKWQIPDDMLGKDPHGNHTGLYRQFLDAFRRNISNGNWFEDNEAQLLKLCSYIGVLARFQSDAGRPGAGDIQPSELHFAVGLVEKECHLMRLVVDAKRGRPSGSVGMFEIWCY